MTFIDDQPAKPVFSILIYRIACSRRRHLTARKSPCKSNRLLLLNFRKARAPQTKAMTQPTVKSKPRLPRVTMVPTKPATTKSNMVHLMQRMVDFNRT